MVLAKTQAEALLVEELALVKAPQVMELALVEAIQVLELALVEVIQVLELALAEALQVLALVPPRAQARALRPPAQQRALEMVQGLEALAPPQLYRQFILSFQAQYMSSTQQAHSLLVWSNQRKTLAERTPSSIDIRLFP